MLSQLARNKRGAEKLLSVYWFVILIMVAFGIFAMVYVFYGAPYDVREIEGDILAQKVADCVSRNGEFNNEILEKVDFDFESGCNFNFDTKESFEENPQYFFSIDVYNVLDTNSPLFSKDVGNVNWKADCFVEKTSGENFERLPVCVEKRLYSVSADNQYLIKILTSVGKFEENVKLK